MVLLTARLRAQLAGVVAALLVSSAAAAQREQAEEAIKAAYLYNFTKFIDWPDSAFTGTSGPFTVCVFADERFRREVQGVLRNETVRGRPIELAPLDAEPRGCHLAYFSSAEADRHSKRLPELRMAPVLTVGEGTRFLDQGGLIAFVVESDRVRFAISRRAAGTAGLTVSSKLLRVARPFDGAPRP
jgi:hypothetical protein